MSAWALQQPVVDQFSPVGGRVVEHHRHVGLDLIEEGAKLDGAVAACAASDDATGLHVKRREQVGGAGPAIVVRAPLGLAGPQRQHGGGAGRGLDLRFLVDAQDDGAMRRSQVAPDHIADLVDEGAIGGQLEGLGPVQLQAEGTQEARDHGLARTRPPSHSPCRPMGRMRRLALQCECGHPLDLSIPDLPRCARTGGSTRPSRR